MNARIERIANELEYDTYIDPTHGRIARDNFIYGVAQAKIEMIEKAKMWLLNNGFVDMESSDCDIHFPSGYIHDFVKAMEE